MASKNPMTSFAETYKSYKVPYWKKLKFRIEATSTYKKCKAVWSQYQYEKKNKPPPGFLSRVFKKATIYTLVAATATAAIAPFAGDYMQQGYRYLFRDQDLALRLEPSKASRSKIEPLYVGSVEMARTIKLQEDLLTLGYPLGKCGANGTFTESDVRAVNWYRKTVGLHTSDYADQDTIDMIAEQAVRRKDLKEIFAGSNEKARDMIVFQPSIFTPSANEKREIRSIQRDLLVAGYKLGACKYTGIMDDETVAAVVQFKKDQRIYPVTSTVDMDVRAQLHTAAAKASTESGTPEVMAQQGVDDLAASLYGKNMGEKELKELAVKYVKERGVAEYIVQAVLESSLKTGMDMTYMMDMASIESTFKPWVTAKCPEGIVCTATGTFQFVQDTWLYTFKRHAGKYGYEKLIAGMNDPVQRQYVLDLRKDPKISALMAAEFALENLETLQRLCGGTIGKPDLYLAHFLGATEAARFINAFRKNPDQPAAALFAKAAESNPGIFYANGQPTSLGYVYKAFSSKMSGKVLRMAKAQGHQKLGIISKPAA